MKTIVFVSGHNYKSKRQGGFHIFAQGCANSGFNVLFFSYPRPIHILFKRNRPLEYKIIWKLFFGGISYEENNGLVKNFTFLNFILPLRLLNYLPKSIVNYFYYAPYLLFKFFCLIKFKNTDIFIIESDAGVMLFSFFKKLFPKAKFVYRPSDPMMNSNQLRIYHCAEKNIVQQCDLNLLVNEHAENLYCKLIPHFKTNVKYSILSNGVNLSNYRINHPIPDIFKDKKIALYVGARPIEWKLILYTAKIIDYITFVIICPENPPEYFRQELSNYSNLIYIQGINPQEVPQYITNADLIIIPNPRNMYKEFSWGMTAKLYQAMSANKPIVIFHDNPSLAKEGLIVTFSYHSFVEAVIKSIDIKNVKYNINLNDKSWDKICTNFIDKLNNL